MMIARLVGFLVFAVFLSSSTATGQSPIVVRIATLASDGGAQAFYAKEKGFFTSGGLDAEVTVMNSSAIAPAIASGTFDFAQSTLATLAAAREHGQPFVVIAPSQLFQIKARPTAGIVVAKASPIKTARDFAGKIVAVSQLLGIAQVTTEAWIDKNGGDSTAVKFIEMPPSAMVAALEQGRVDAAEFGEPELADALSRGHRSLSSGYEAVADRFQIGAWYCTSSYAAAHPDAVRRFANVMAETARWANTHQAESGRILAKWTKLTVEPTMPRVMYGERLNLTLMQPLIDVAAKYKALRSAIPASDMIAAGIRPE
jgi:NitT/TauT family transport system substrate-binding protein